MDIAPQQHWTLRKQLRTLFLLALTFVAFCFLFGLWRVQQFNHHRMEIQNSSLRLQQNLKANFDKTKAIGRIQTQLRLYMHSGKKEHLSETKSEAEALLEEITEENKNILLQFLKKVDILEVRLDSLSENNIKIFQAEKNILTKSGQIIKTLPPEQYFKLRAVVSDACLEHHHLYVTSIISNQSDTLIRIQQQFSELYDEVDKQLVALMAVLPESSRAGMESLRDEYFTLEDGVQTVTSIRITITETQNQTVKVLEQINSAITTTSLDQEGESARLMADGLSLAQRNLVIMSVSLVLAALMFAVIAFFLHTRMIKPLVDFIELLRRMTALLAGMRTKQVSEDENFLSLSNMSDKRHDEIGEVAEAVKRLILRLRELSIFRQTIEADEMTSEIYTRLARIFMHKLGLDTFIIYEKNSKSKGMLPIYCQPPEIEEDLPDFSVADRCRAQRTGTLITSQDDLLICKQFPLHDVMHHVCIPMMVGGQVIGVVQFLYSMDLSRSEHLKITRAIEEARHYILEALPVLQSKHLAEKLEEMATEDQLTGLYNRRYLESSLEQIVAGVQRRQTKLGVLMCDMDYFKQVNDNYGHDAGDAVLIQLAQLLSDSVRKSDMVIRFGGEEFLILLVDCQDSQAAQLGEKVRKVVEEHKFQIGGQSIQKTLSIGVSEFPIDSAKGIWEVIKHADVALYKAKEQGRNRVVEFNLEMWPGDSY